MRKTQFAIGEYYHIYNRGVDKRNIFLCKKDYSRFLICIKLLNDEREGLMEKWRNVMKSSPRAQLSDIRELSSGRRPLVDFIVYCLNPNHEHFIMKQLVDKGIEKFMHKLGTSYTNYFNKKYDRSGALFQGRYKSIHINSNEYLLYLSAYINMNNFIHGYTDTIEGALNDPWIYSSLPDYLGKRDGKLCNKSIIFEQFDNNFPQYEKYLKDNALYFKEKKEMEGYILE